MWPAGALAHQTEAHRVAALLAWRKDIAGCYHNNVRPAMNLVDDLVQAAQRADLARLVFGSGLVAFHEKTLGFGWTASGEPPRQAYYGG
jgi:hypothetical protein